MDFMDIDLPMPLKVAENSRYSASYWNKETDSSYRITYAIDGYFSTGAGKQYLHDVAGRIAYALNGTYEIEESTKVSRNLINCALRQVISFKNGLIFCSVIKVSRIPSIYKPLHIPKSHVFIRDVMILGSEFRVKRSIILVFVFGP